MSSTLSPPYAHLPTSISTTPGHAPESTTTTAFMPSVGSRRILDDVLYVKDQHGWLTRDEFDPRGRYADATTALLLEGWRVVTDNTRTGDICLGRTWLRPPRPDDVLDVQAIVHVPVVAVSR